MSNDRKAAHTVYQFHYHFVFIPKYHKQVLRGEINSRLREMDTGNISEGRHRDTAGAHTTRPRAYAFKRVAAKISEPSDAGNQGKDLMMREFSGLQFQGDRMIVWFTGE